MISTSFFKNKGSSPQTKINFLQAPCDFIKTKKPKE